MKQENSQWNEDQGTSYGTEDKHSSVATTDSCLDVNCHSCEKNWTHTPSTSGSYGRLADEIWVEVEIFKILYGLNYSDFTTFNISAMLL